MFLIERVTSSALKQETQSFPVLSHFSYFCCAKKKKKNPNFAATLNITWNFCNKSFKCLHLL